MYRYATLAPANDARRWTAGPGLQGWVAPTERPRRLPGRAHAAMRPQQWATTPRDDASRAQRREPRMEHRVGKRHRAFRLVTVLQDGIADGSGLLYNVSRNGMFVLTRHPVGTNLCIDIVLPVPDGTPVRLSTLIVHRSDHGLGLIFRHLDLVAAAAVEAHCTRH
jgi:hypothetical protein